MPGPYKWRKRFQGHGSRWTAPREAVLELLSRTSLHMSAKDIYSAVHKVYPNIGLTTIYRTLDLIYRMGIIDKIVLSDGQARYQFKSGKQDNHHHLICTECGKIIDYREFEKEELEFIKKAERRLSEEHQFIIMDHKIEFLGICTKCQPKKNMENEGS
jgi:Fur family ferric uptake transcriptional regulator